MDHEIAYSLANTANAEASLNHVWDVKEPTAVQLHEDIDESISDAKLEFKPNWISCVESSSRVVVADVSNAAKIFSNI